MPIDPERMCARQMRAAEGYLALGMPDHALKELDAIPEIVQDSFGVWLYRGESLRMKQEHRQALESFSKAHLRSPTDLTALMGMAWCYKRIDQLHRAIDTMKLAYQFHKSEPVVLYNLACYYALAGEKENALSWLGRSLRMDRDRRLLSQIPDESDFDPIRDDAEFRHLLELMSSEQA